MKVYITYEKDGYGNRQVDKIFVSEESVRLYVTNDAMVDRAKTVEELAKMQEEQFEVCEVIDY